jgi:transaldolase
MNSPARTQPAGGSHTMSPTAPPAPDRLAQLSAEGIVNTMPEATIEAVADHAELRGDTVRGAYDEARRVFAGLQGLGIDYDDVIEVLEGEGVEKFSASWSELLDTIDKKMARLREQPPWPPNQPPTGRAR